MVVVVSARMLARTNPGPEGGWVTQGQRWQALGVVGGAGLVGAAYRALSATGPLFEVVLFGAVTRGGALAAGAAVLVCLVWWLRRPPRSTGQRQARSAAAGR